MNPLATQLEAAADPGTGDWYAAFRLGDSFFRFNGDSLRAVRTSYIEPIAFPQPLVSRSGNTTTRFETRPPTAARSISLSPERVHILFGGTTERRNRWVDSYSRRDGTYMESLLLPEPAISIAWYRGGFHVLQENPSPELVHRTPTGRSLP